MSLAERKQVIAAVPTPFDRHGRLDVDGTRRLFEHMASTDLDGLFVNGTAGEFAAMDRLERRRVAEIAVAVTPAGKRVVVHIGAASSKETLDLLDDVRQLGVTEVAVITPYFLAATEAAIVDHYRRVSDAADGMQVYPYLYRQVTGNAIDEALLARLAELPNMAGAKISGETPERIARYVSATPPTFVIYAGADQELAAMVEHGAAGVVSAMSAGLPRPFTRLAQALSRDDATEISTAQKQVDDVCTVIANSIAHTKAALRLQGVDAGYPRLPVLEPDPHSAAEIARIVRLYATPPTG